MDIQILSVMNYRLSLVLIVFSLLFGCLKEESYVPAYQQKLIVDGRIELGRHAIVSLSLNEKYDGGIDSLELSDMIVRWAKVTVSNGVESEILTGRFNEDYQQKFIYTGSEIVGKENETYTLNIEYSGQSWSATTTIPEASELHDISVEWVNDTLYRIKAYLPPTPNNAPCMVECALNESMYYKPALACIFDSNVSGGYVTINRPINYTEIKSYTTLFNIQDVVRLRFSTMPQFGYDYWSMWENNVINNLNPIFPAQHNPISNISNNAIGAWIGYASVYYDVKKAEPQQ